MWALCIAVATTHPLPAQTKYGWEKVHPRPGEDTLTNVVLYNVHFVDTQNGFIVGERGTVLRTTDAESWEKLDIPLVSGPPPSLSAIASDAAGNVYVGGWSAIDVEEGVLWRSTDLGETWTDLNMAPGIDIVELICTDATTMFAVGDSGLAGAHIGTDRRAVILKSTDAGESWRTVAKVDSRYAPNFGVCMRDIDFPSADTGYAVGEKGIALQTTDGGESWKSLDSWYRTDLYGLHFFSGTDGIFFGEASRMPHTSDGGMTWDTLIHNFGFIFDVHFIRPELGFVCNAGIERTTDQGRTWTWDVIEAIDPAHPSASPQFRAITFSDAQHGWAVGDHRSGVIYRTTTGGLVHTDRIPAAEKPSLSISPSPLRSRQQATVRVDLPRQDNVRITVYDMLGRAMQSIYEGEMSAGSHHLSLRIGALRPGTYILVLSASDGIMSRTFVLL
ncbi:MAG: YCF48-related protein [Bacteroidota bacterium]|nr:YCF48-related protein [Bacteroidota bacterium]